MDGWNTTFLSGRPIFRGKLFVSGRVEPQGGPQKPGDKWCYIQGIVGCTPTNVPLWEIPI